MPRTTAVESPGCPPLRVLTTDILGLVKVIEARAKPEGAAKVVETWGAPDASRAIVAASLADRVAQPVLAVARKNGLVELLNPLNGDSLAAIKTLFLQFNTFCPSKSNNPGQKLKATPYAGQTYIHLALVRLYDTALQRRPAASVNFRESPIKAVAADPNGHDVYIGTGTGDLASYDMRTGLDSYLRIWDTNTRQLLSAVFLKQHLTTVVIDSHFSVEEPGEMKSKQPEPSVEVQTEVRKDKKKKSRAIEEEEKQSEVVETVSLKSTPPREENLEKEAKASKRRARNSKLP